MTDQDGTIPDLAALVRAVLYSDRTARVYAERITSRLIGADAGTDGIEAGLRRALGALVPGADELAAAIRDTPILVENYGYDDSVGAFTATAMLPDELAAALLDKAWDEARP